MTVNRIAVKFIGFPVLRRKLGENRVEVAFERRVRSEICSGTSKKPTARSSGKTC